MGTTDATIADKKLYRGLKKGKEKEEMPEDSVTKKKKRREMKGDSSMVVDGVVEKQQEDGEAKSAPQKEKDKKKKDKASDKGIEVDPTPVEETKTSEKQKEKEKKKRKRDTEADAAQPETSPQPKKKSKKARGVEQQEMKDETRQPTENAKPKRKINKSQGAASETAEPSEIRKKKRHKNKTGFPNPEENSDDTNLSDQARKALTYAFSQFHDPSQWKFNKARQNWLVRNYWSSASIPEKYEELVVKYLSAVQGNTRENLIKTCRTIIDEQSKGEKSTDKSESIGGTLTDTPSPLKPIKTDPKKTRALALLQALLPDADP